MHTPKTLHITCSLPDSGRQAIAIIRQAEIRRALYQVQWVAFGMRVLVACEYSGRVRDAFIKRGHDAMSCDLLPTDSPGPHYCGSVFDVIGDGWDLMIAHPPCTHLAVSGARHFAEKKASGVQDEALDFVRMLLNAPIKMIALENPISIISSRIRKPDQIIQPWQFGHGETKSTCLWLKNLPLLKPTNIVDGREARVHKLPPTADRRPLEAEKYNVPRHCRCYGRSVGTFMGLP